MVGHGGRACCECREQGHRAGRDASVSDAARVEYARYFNTARLLARFSKSDALCGTPWLAGCITCDAWLARQPFKDSSRRCHRGG
jgi:hypothetical protein